MLRRVGYAMSITWLGGRDARGWKSIGRLVPIASSKSHQMLHALLLRRFIFCMYPVFKGKEVFDGSSRRAFSEKFQGPGFWSKIDSAGRPSHNFPKFFSLKGPCLLSCQARIPMQPSAYPSSFSPTTTSTPLEPHIQILPLLHHLPP